MSLWQKLRALSLAQVGLLVEAGVVLVLAWVGLRMLPYGVLRRLHGEKTVFRDGSAGAAAGPPATIPWALGVMAGRLPGKMTCLVQALAAQAMLRRRGYRSELRIGVAGRDPDGTIKAHAWVECDGHVVVGGVEDLSSYTLLSSPTGP